MFTVTAPDGATDAVSELGCARLVADGCGIGSTITDDAGVVIYVCTPESLDPAYDLFND